MKRYIVAYELSYVHHCEFGIEAKSGSQAKQIIKTMLNNGSLFFNTDIVPRLRDEFMEVDNGPLELTVQSSRKMTEPWPEPDQSVKEIYARENAFQACRVLLEGYKKGDMLDPLMLDEAVTHARRALHNLGQEV